MELCTKIRQFADLQTIVNPETKSIFQPFLAEVERQGQKVLLFPPIESTMWVEWPIKRPKGDYFVYYHYVSLMIQAGQEANDLNLVVVARIADSPKKFVREIFKERYRAGWEFNDMPERADKWEEEEPDFGEIYSDRGLAELERFSLNREIYPEVIAEKLVAHARRIYKFLTINANEFRKVRAQRRARVRKKQAIAQPAATTSTN